MLSTLILESLIKPHTTKAVDKTELRNKHKDCEFGYQVVRYDGKAENPVICRGSDAVENFVECLEDERKKINNVFSHPKPLVMTSENTKKIESAASCWICKGKFGEDRVRDHCHITGNYRGPAHNNCNLKLRIKPYVTQITVIFHNLKRYDSHLIMQKIAKATGNITCIPNNTEKYISFSLGQLKFPDSFQFMSSSLEKLVKASAKDDFKITKKTFGDKTDFLCRKGVYPYEYIDNWEKCNETELPPIENGYSSINYEVVNPEDYEHAQIVWKEFNCKTLGDYHDLYFRLSERV